MLLAKRVNRNVVLIIAVMATLNAHAMAQELPKPDKVLETSLGKVAAGEAEILDLTHALNDKSPFWPGEDYQPFQLRTIATLDKNGVSSKAFAMPEHFGTHLDAPNHFEQGQPSVDEIPATNLFAPGIVIDISLQAEMDPDYLLSVADVTTWEKSQGRIPDRAVVLLNTGWGRHWNNSMRYRNQDALGKMHFPGYSAEAARWLVKERNVRGIGIDTLSIDHGPSKDFVVHHIINGAGRYGLENIANVGKLPARNFFLIVAPIKISTGTGGPTRLFAIMPNPNP